MKEATGDPQGSAVEPKHTELSTEQLNKILGAHRKWVESEKAGGTKANLRRTNLKHANLEDAVRTEDDLSRATKGAYRVRGLSRLPLLGSPQT